MNIAQQICIGLMMMSLGLAILAFAGADEIKAKAIECESKGSVLIQARNGNNFCVQGYKVD